MVKIFFDNELLELTEDDLNCMFVNAGSEGKVYRYGRDALKIYKGSCYKSRLSEEACHKLREFSTSRVLLPEKVIYDGDTSKFIGYSTSFIYTEPVRLILNLRVAHFVNELDIIRDDLRMLANNGVEIDDWHINNVLFDGEKIFIGDPGGMRFKREITHHKSFNNNLFVMNRFLKDDLFSECRLSMAYKRNIENVFDDFQYMGDFIRETAKDSENVRQYVKRMTR